KMRSFEPETRQDAHTGRAIQPASVVDLRINQKISGLHQAKHQPIYQRMPRLQWWTGV
ncbi:MAG: hypothetical protein ACI814_005069, partial [Mariniblastus sp.]